MTLVCRKCGHTWIREDENKELQGHMIDYTCSVCQVTELLSHQSRDSFDVTLPPGWEVGIPMETLADAKRCQEALHEARIYSPTLKHCGTLEFPQYSVCPISSRQRPIVIGVYRGTEVPEELLEGLLEGVAPKGHEEILNANNQ